MTVTCPHSPALAVEPRSAAPFAMMLAPTPEPIRQTTTRTHMLDGIEGPVTRFSIGVFLSEVVMTLYRARYGPYHSHLWMTRTRHGWAISSLDRI